MITEEEMYKISDRLSEYIYNEYDGGANVDGKPDDRLFLEMVYPNTDQLTKKEYEQFEEACNRIQLVTDKYEIYFGIDGSGYDYWTKTMKESNYIGTTIQIKDANLSDEEISKLHDDIFKVLHELEDELSMDITMFM